MSTLAPEEAKNHPIEINGYAIVSDDDRIAGPDGLIPASLRNERDWECFQRALAGSDLVVLGHRSHELAPNVRGDQRLVISRDAAGLEQYANVCWWNPARMRWAEVAKELLPRGGDVPVPGGQIVFDLFLKIGFDAFHLSRAHGVMLPRGRALFSGCDAGLSAEAVLASAGLRVSERIVLDAEHGVDMSVWRAVREPTLRREKIGEQGSLWPVLHVAANDRICAKRPAGIDVKRPLVETVQAERPSIHDYLYSHSAPTPALDPPLASTPACRRM
jgi:hypothetical protein